MAEPLLTYRGAVYPWHCDHMGHMNVMWYVGKFDEATWNLFTALGLDPAFLRANGRGMAAVEQNIAYKKELMAGDVVTVYSAVLEIKDRVIRFSHEMRMTDTGETAATTVITAVHLDTAARRATAFSPEIRARAQGLLVPAAS
jgi:acyl-CoA thioester hydrolase